MLPNNLKISKAKPNEWKAIQELNNEVFINDKKSDEDLDLKWPSSKKGIKYYKKLASGKYGHCLIAYLDAFPIGYVALAIKGFGWRKSKYVEVENIGVRPSYRSKGMGHLLIKEAVKWAKTQKATRLYVAAYFKNKKAIKFYKREGFYEMGIEFDRKI